MVIAVRFEGGLSKVFAGAAVEAVAQCRFCLGEAKGPQGPWCCDERANHYAAKILCGEHAAFVSPFTEE